MLTDDAGRVLSCRASLAGVDVDAAAQCMLSNPRAAAGGTVYASRCPSAHALKFMVQASVKKLFHVGETERSAAFRELTTQILIESKVPAVPSGTVRGPGPKTPPGTPRGVAFKAWIDNQLQKVSTKASKASDISLVSALVAAQIVRYRSDDDDSKAVGAVVLNRWNDIIALGWNGYPKGLNRRAFTSKIPIIHAEQDALLFRGNDVVDWSTATLVTTRFPCSACTDVIIALRIQRVVAFEHDDRPDKLAQEKSDLDKLVAAGITVDIFSSAATAARKSSPPVSGSSTGDGNPVVKRACVK